MHTPRSETIKITHHLKFKNSVNHFTIIKYALRFQLKKTTENNECAFKIIVLAFVFYFSIDVYSRNMSTAKQAHYAVPTAHDEEKKKGEEVDFYIRPLRNVEEC